MRKILHVISSLVILAAGVSCVKEIPGQARNDSYLPKETELKTVTFHLHIGDATKASAIGATDEDAISRIDVYEYEPYGSSNYPAHYQLTAAELASGEFHLQYPTGTTRQYLFFANLPESVADKITNTTAYNLSGVQVRMQDLWDGVHFPMADFAYVNYNNDKTLNIYLNRYHYRVDVGDVKIDFDDASWMNKTVYVKTVALINVANTYVFSSLSNSCYSHDDGLTMLFGDSRTAEDGKPYFGGLTSGRRGFDAYSGYSGYTYCFNFSGGSSISTPNLYNNNIYKAKGVFTLDAPSTALENAVVQRYNTGSGEGRITSTLSVNRSFYAWASAYESGSWGILQTFSNQNTYTKLVVELLIDGVSHFYPIQIFRPQPNTIYKLDRITIRSEGSEYANFFEKLISMDAEISVLPWEEVDIANIDTGYTDEHHTGTYNNS